MGEQEALPADRLEIRDLETLRMLSDPLRMRLVELLRRGPGTVKDLAAALDLPPKSLYYHINLLEKHGLIRVVDTRLVSGILEKRYLAGAYLFVFSDLSSPEGGAGAEGTQVMVSSLLETTNQEIRESIRAGRLDPALGKDGPPDRALCWNWSLLTLTPEEAADLTRQLQEVIAAYPSYDGNHVPADRHTFRLLYAVFPTYDRGTPAAQESE